MRTLAIATPLIAGTCAAQAQVPADVLAARVRDLADTKVRSGFALRDRYGLPQHRDSPAIYVDWSNNHHVTLETSVILWKDRAGHWQRDEATELSPGLLRMGPRLESHSVAPLPAASERLLERLIRDRKLYRQPTPSVSQVGYGIAAIEIHTRYGQATVVSYAGQSGPVPEIMNLVSSRPNEPASVR